MTHQSPALLVFLKTKTLRRSEKVLKDVVGWEQNLIEYLGEFFAHCKSLGVKE
jgi:hypothetical protein